MGGVAIDDRRKDRTPFLNFICMFVRHFSSGGARSSVGWTSRCVGVLIWHIVSVSHVAIFSNLPPPQGIIMFLQSLPTQDWTDDEIEMLLSQAFVLNSIWHNAQSHFTGK